QSWDLDGNGSFGDAFGPTATIRYGRAGTHTVSLRVTDPDGLIAVATRTLGVRDKTPPRVRLIVARVFHIRRAIRHGIRFKVRSNEAGRIRIRLVVSRRTARKLGLRTRTIGRGSARLHKAGTKRVRVKL